MNTTLLVNLSGNTYERIDLFEEIPITLTIQQQDLTNLTSRRVPYSRTIQVPDTSNNAILFEHYYEVNGTEFNPLNKIKCVVQYRGTDIFQGILRLNSVSQTNETRFYEIFILGTVSDWVSYFRDLELQDLDYSDLVHEQAYSAVTKSWECENDGLTGLFGGKVLYPLINYGLDYQGDPQQPTFTMDFDGTRSFDQSGFAMPVSYFKPAIQLKTVLDRVFLTTPFEVRSDFFDTPYFRSIYMDTFQNGKVGIETASGITNQNIFLAQTQQFQFNYFPATPPSQIGPQRLTMNVNTPGGYDPLGNVVTTSNLSTFQSPYAGQYDFNVRFNLRANLAFLLPIQGAKLALVAYISNSPSVYGSETIAYQSPDILLSQSVLQELPVNLFFSVNMLAGQYLTIALVPQQFFIPSVIASSYTYLVRPFNQGGVVDDFVRWELYQGPILTTEIVDMRVGMPNLGCFDFFKSMITMFNLVVQQEDDNVVRIEPYNWFYDDNQRPEKDWTNILDVNSQYKIEPLTFDLSKDVLWTYKSKEF